MNKVVFMCLFCNRVIYIIINWISSLFFYFYINRSLQSACLFVSFFH